MKIRKMRGRAQVHKKKDLRYETLDRINPPISPFSKGGLVQCAGFRKERYGIYTTEVIPPSGRES
ncbi:MAG: hypothetical protein B5M53_09130 [Candidatus Cloacimonas sp. 4484_209]|nr:MAG: hypothetical protein B5M53_09130 [Candidatus Cloacimonas sp. 4484_209]